MCFIKWAHNTVHRGSWPPRWTDCLLTAGGLPFATNSWNWHHYTSILWFMFVRRQWDIPFPENRILSPQKGFSDLFMIHWIIKRSLKCRLSSAFKVSCLLCCDLGKERFLKRWGLFWVKNFIREEKNRATKQSKEEEKKKVCWRLSLWQDCRYTAHTGFKNNIIHAIQVDN